MPKRFSSTIALLLAPVLVSAAEPIPLSFPDDAGVLDVREFGAVADDESDDTEAIQKALDAVPNGNRIIYLPPGTFLVSDTLRWPASENTALAQRRTILQGAGMTLTLLRVPKDTQRFRGDEDVPVIWTGDRPAQRFRNAVRDLTIEIGPGNYRAIGMQFNATDQGCVRNVAIRSEDGSGKIGLDLGYTDEIGPLFVRNLEVDGFEVGISTKWPVHSNTFEHISLKRQRRFGWWNYHQMIFVRGLISENRVTALYNERNSWGSVTLLDSHLHGVDTPHDAPGIINQRQLYLRNVDLLGYRKQVDNDDRGREKGDIDKPGLVIHDTGHRNVAAQFREIKDGTFREVGDLPYLPVKEPPSVAWGDVGKDWVNIANFGADPTGVEDSSGALQEAIDSGAGTVYLPAGARFRFAGMVEIRGPVRRIVGLEGRTIADAEAMWRLVDGRHPRGLKDARAVVVERMENENGLVPLKIRHESARTLAVSSTSGFDVEGRGAGDIFLDDFRGHLDLLKAGQSAWCRQINSTRAGVKCQNRGGKLWILGMKAEQVGTAIETTRGGTTNLFGMFLHSNTGWEEAVPAFLIEDSTAILAGIDERNFNRHRVSLWFRETRAGETRERKEPAWVYLSGPPTPP